MGGLTFYLKYDSLTIPWKKEVLMESKQDRRQFLKHCATFGGACFALVAFNWHLQAEESPEKKNGQEQKPIDLKPLGYCGIPCAKVCELYKATQENDVKAKKAVYEKWEMKKKFGIEFDPDKIFCYTCKPGDKPLKVGMDQCAVRNCAMANGFESCIQCKNLAACDKEFWKTWPDMFEFSKKLQARYLTQPGATLLEVKTS
jgi:hypothetical protein